MAHICEWLTEKVDSYSSRLAPEPKDVTEEVRREPRRRNRKDPKPGSALRSVSGSAPITRAVLGCWSTPAPPLSAYGSAAIPEL